MFRVDFSLTEQIIINPVLRLRADPLNTSENPLTIPGRVSHFFQSEVITRIIAVATSFFAAIDCMVHLTMAVDLSLRKLGIHGIKPTSGYAEIIHHFKESAKFLGIMVIGSIAATILPGNLKYFRTNSRSGSSKKDWKSTSETVQNLWKQTADKKVFDKLWNSASIIDRRIFVSLLDNDSSLKAMKAKSELIDTIYRKIIPILSKQWPRQEDTPVFYHATSLEGLEGILKSGKIEVRHEKAYRGAFVSTKPETGFGEYVLVFNRNIERLSHLNHGFSAGNAYWAGFSHDIPVNAMTLNGIINGKYGEASSLQNSCNVWAGRKIEVTNLSSNNSIPGDKEIPKEWPGDDPNSVAIQNTMKIRAKQYQAQKVSMLSPKVSVQQHQKRMVFA